MSRFYFIFGADCYRTWQISLSSTCHWLTPPVEMFLPPSFFSLRPRNHRQYLFFPVYSCLLHSAFSLSSSFTYAQRYATMLFWSPLTVCSDAASIPNNGIVLLIPLTLLSAATDRTVSTKVATKNNSQYSGILSATEDVTMTPWQFQRFSFHGLSQKKKKEEKR